MKDKQYEHNEEENLKNRRAPAQHLKDHDLYETIQFSKKDLEQLRQSSSDKLDSDYFVNSPHSNRGTGDANETFNQEPVTYEELEEMYHAPEPTPPQQKEKKRHFLEESYEEHYSLETLDDLESYNQFGTSEQQKPKFKLTRIKSPFWKFKDTTPTEEAVEIPQAETYIEIDEEGTQSHSTEVDNFQEETAPESKEQVEEALTRGSFVDKFKAYAAKFGVKLPEDEPKEIDNFQDEEAITEEPPKVQQSLEATPPRSPEEATIGNVEIESLPQEEEVEPQPTFFDRVKTYTAKWGVRLPHSDKTLGEEADEWSEEEVAEYSDTLSQETMKYSEPILTDQVFEELLNEDDLTIEHELQEQQNLVKGTAWLTFGNVFSRILGAVYVIPWATWIGAEYIQANGLFSIGYTPYAWFLAVATAGFPSAVAKQMAYFHSKKEYRVADKLFKYSMLIMLVTGLISGGLLFALAPILAAGAPTDDPAAAVLVIRSLVPALLILPVMSLLRGYFQGFNDMAPTAVSQIVEQVLRVAYMLMATYVITQIYRGEVTTAVVHSTFAAFVGAVGSLGYLAFLYVKRLPLMRRLIAQSREGMHVDFKESLRIMLMDSIPFILLGSGIIIAKLIDQYTFSPILLYTTVLRKREIQELFGVLSLDVDKLIMIIISLAVAISTSAIPAITSKFSEGDRKGTSQLIERITVLFSYIMLPAAVGMASMSRNVYTLFYPSGSVHGPSLLVTACYMSIALGAYTVLSAILQSMDFRRMTIQYLFIGLAVKAILQVPFVALFGTQGALISTLVAFVVSSGLMWWKIHRVVTINYVELLPQLSKIAIGTAVMGVTTTIWNYILNGAFSDVGRGMTFVKVILITLVGAFVYFAVMALFGMLSVLFGNRHKDLQDKLKVM